MWSGLKKIQLVVVGLFYGCGHFFNFFLNMGVVRLKKLLLGVVSP